MKSCFNCKHYPYCITTPSGNQCRYEKRQGTWFSDIFRPLIFRIKAIRANKKRSA